MVINMSTPKINGSVIGIYIAQAAGAPLRSLDRAELVAGRGIVGDRYFSGVGKFSPAQPDPDHELTLIEIEEIDRFNAATGLGLAPGAFRRNVITQGVALNALVGIEFRLGALVIQGLRLCEPCAYLAGLVHREVLARMVHRAGLRARVVHGGALRVGVAIGAGETHGRTGAD